MSNTDVKMRRIPPTRLVCATAFVFVLATSSIAGRTRVRVEFTTAGECVVSTEGASGQAKVKYARRTPELRCEVTALARPPAGENFELEVVLPAGAARPSGEFPRLRWEEREGRWIGVTHLPAPPAFVRLPPEQGIGRWRARVLDITVLAATALAVVWSVVRGRKS